MIELILVMALLTIVMAAISPYLGGFLRGRSLDHEVRRFVSLAQYAQARAANEGQPMRLWADPSLRAYGLSAEVVYDGSDPRAVEYELSPEIQMEVDTRTWSSISGVRPTVIPRWSPSSSSSATGNRRILRFTPDGGIDPISPWGVWFRHQPDANSKSAVSPHDQVFVAQNLYRLRYEVQTNQNNTLYR